ncbi:MAG: helix-hairpin-helix domain-containing protein [Verrucomicrobiota bacterium]
MPPDEEDNWSLSKIPLAWLGNVLAALAFCTLMTYVLQDGRRQKPPTVPTLSQSPNQGQKADEAQALSPVTTEDTRIDINNASRPEVESLPGIGETIAREIIARRPFATVESLNEVPGIGPKRLAKLIPLIKIGSGRPTAPEDDR